MRFIVLAACAATALAQTSPTPIQPLWEGVPDAYRRIEYPQIEIPSTAADWDRRKVGIRATLLELLGDIPPRPERLAVRVEPAERRNGYTRQKVFIDNAVDSQIPAWLIIPDNARKPAPAVLCLHWHSSDKDGPLFSGDSQNVLQPLLDRGYILLSIDGAFHGERLGTGPGGDMHTEIPAQREALFKLNLWLGRTLWGMMVRDTRLAVDYLQSLPEVDPERIGVQGMSMGGTGAWWLGALDERVKAVVTVACFTRYEELIATRWINAHAIYYFVPGLLKHFDTEAILGLVAPRPLLALTGDRDTTSPPQGVRTLDRKLTEIYSLYGAEEKFESILYEDTGHTYTDAMKREMVAWFDRWL